MPGVLTEVTEIATALGTLSPDLATGIAQKPDRLHNVDGVTWDRLVAAFEAGEHLTEFEAAFRNGAAFLHADDGLRCRPPLVVEWKGPHRVPGDDVIPADLRIDHVYQVSCKYLSRILQNAGPARLFDRLLAGEERARADWFGVIAPAEYQAFYDAARAELDAAAPDLVGELDLSGSARLPTRVSELDASHRKLLKPELRARRLPDVMQQPWADLCAAVSTGSAERWAEQLRAPKDSLRMLWRLLRIGDAPYFILGIDGSDSLQLRVASAWDWMQDFELRSFTVEARSAGQPEVGWRALVRHRAQRTETEVLGHVEVRWSHGRFQAMPEAKIYLDTPHRETPGYFPLR